MHSLDYCECGKIGYPLWNLETKKTICRHDLVFNKDWMHKRPVSIVEIYRVILQDFGLSDLSHLPDASNAKQQDLLDPLAKHEHVESVETFCKGILCT